MNLPGNRTDETLGSDTIGKVFASLRDAEAPAGMEDRILRTLEARQQRHSRASSLPKIRVPQVSTLRPGSAAWTRKPATYIAASLALASLLIALTFVHPTQRPETTPLPPQLSTIPIASKSPEVLPQQSTRRPTQTILGAKPAPAPQAAPLSDEDALALSEMLAPSKPAPPLPLTRQEKLLAEVVHHGAPEELASLRPDVRAREIEIAKAEFHDFFEPPALNPPPAKANE